MKFRRLVLIVFSILAFLPLNSLAAENNYFVKDLRSAKNSADYIAIVPKAFLSEIQPLLDKRAADGLRVVAVTPERIYKDFDRWPAGPKAIREFVRYASFKWQQPAPKYLLLAGDIDVYDEYDPKGVQVPTFMIHMQDGYDMASDNPYADTDGDEIPDIPVGRIPADDASQLKIVVGKILAFETNPPPGPWRRRISAFASTGNFGALDSTLEEITRKIVRANFDPAFDMNMTYGGSYLPYFMLPDDFRPKILSRFEEGSLLMSYIGHGGVTGLSSVCYKNECRDILENEDVPKIVSNGKTPFFVSTCCLTGKFNGDTECIAEQLLKSNEGPVGVLAASRDSSPYSNALLSKDMLYFGIKKRPATIGEAVLNMKRGLVQRFDPERKLIDKMYKLQTSDAEMKKDTYDHIYMYNYFGDPATRIPFPADSIKITAPSTASAGSEIQTTVQTKDKLPGRALITLECHPTEVIHDITNIENLSGDALKLAVAKNYAAANDKTAAKIDTNLDSTGAVSVKIKITAELASGTYYIKAYAWDGTPDSMGMAEIKITNDKPGANIEQTTISTGFKNEPAKPAKAEPDDLDKIIKNLKEPDISKYPAIDSYAMATAYEPPKEKTIEELEADVKANPSDPNAIILLAGGYKNILEFDKEYETLKMTDSLSMDLTFMNSVAGMYSQLYKMGDAIPLLKKSISMYPKNPDAYNQLASVYEQTGDFEEAIKVLNDSIKNASETPAAYEATARCYTKLGKMDDAKKMYVEADRILPASDVMNSWLFYVYRDTIRDKELAEKKAREIIADHAFQGWQWIMPDFAQLLVSQNDENLGEAIKIIWAYHKLIKSEYPKARALADVAVDYLKQRPGNGIHEKLIGKSLEISPKCAACVSAGWEWVGVDDAIQKCERAVALDPGFADGYRCLGAKYYWKDFNKSVEYYEKSYSIKPHVLGMRGMIVSMLQAGEKDKALALLNDDEFMKRASFNEVEQDDANYRINRIDLFEDAGQYDLAEQEYQKFITKYPASGIIHHYMAERLCGYGDCARAAELEKLALKRNPLCQECLMDLGTSSIELRNYGDAEEAFSRAMKLDPNNSYLIANLGKVYFLTGRRDEARKLFRQAQKLDPANGISYEYLKQLIDPGIYFN